MNAPPARSRPAKAEAARLKKPEAPKAEKPAEPKASQAELEALRRPLEEAKGRKDKA